MHILMRWRGLAMRTGLCLVAGWAIAAITATALRRLFEPTLGPWVLLWSFLIFPIATTFVLGEWWGVLISPLVYWGVVCILSWPTSYIGVETWKMGVVPVFTLLSLGGGLFGVVSRRLLEGIKEKG